MSTKPNYAELVKHELVRLCKERNIKHKSKATKQTLVMLLEEADAPAKPKRKARLSTKSLIREKFPQVGDKVKVDDLVEHVTSKASVKRETIGTMLGDLRNAKYAAGPVVDIKREGDVYVRHA